MKQIRDAIDGNKPIRTVLKNYRKDGSLFWNELSVTPFYDEVDELEYFIGIQKDVTAEVMLQEQLDEAQEKISELEAEIKMLKQNT